MADTVLVADPEGGPPTSRPMTPEEQAQIDADRAAAAELADQVARATTFAQSDDAERLRIVAERAAEDPAFAALAELALGGKGV